MSVTKTGFEFQIDEEALNDMELLEGFTALEAGNNDAIKVLPKLISNLIGAEQKKALYDHVRTEGGRVPVDAVMAEVTDMFLSLSEDKKK